MVKKPVHTSIDPELWKEAQFKDVKWSQAIELGVKLLTKSNDKIPEIEQKIKENEQEIVFLRQKIKDLRKKSEEEAEKRRSRIIFTGAH